MGRTTESMMEFGKNPCDKHEEKHSDNKTEIKVLMGMFKIFSSQVIRTSCLTNHKILYEIRNYTWGDIVSNHDLLFLINICHKLHSIISIDSTASEKNICTVLCM